MEPETVLFLRKPSHLDPRLNEVVCLFFSSYNSHKNLALKQIHLESHIAFISEVLKLEFQKIMKHF